MSDNIIKFEYDDIWQVEDYLQELNLPRYISLSFKQTSNIENYIKKYKVLHGSYTKQLNNGAYMIVKDLDVQVLSDKQIQLGARSLTSSKFKKIDISNTIVESGTDLFEKSFVKEIIADNIEILNKSAQGMFRECENLTKVRLRLKDKQLNPVSSMFQGCSSLTDIDIDELDCTNVKSLDNLFIRCRNLKNIDLRFIKTSNKLQTMYGMFCDCVYLEQVNLDGLVTDNVREASSMFKNCWKLKEIDMSNLNLSQCVNFDSCFMECEHLETIKFNSKIKIKPENTYEMFRECKIKELCLSSFDMSIAYGRESMFTYAYIGKLDLRGSGLSYKNIERSYFTRDNVLSD